MREPTELHRRTARPKLGSEWPSVSVWANLGCCGSDLFFYAIFNSLNSSPAKTKACDPNDIYGNIDRTRGRRVARQAIAGERCSGGDPLSVSHGEELGQLQRTCLTPIKLRERQKPRKPPYFHTFGYPKRTCCADFSHLRWLYDISSSSCIHLGYRSLGLASVRFPHVCYLSLGS